MGWWRSPTGRGCCATPSPATPRTPAPWARNWRIACSQPARARSWNGCAALRHAAVNMQPLHGVGVLVTRPEQQATPLCRLLESAGAQVLRLPVIDIRAAADLSDIRGRLGRIGAFDLVIFTSANAVRFGG